MIQGERQYRLKGEKGAMVRRYEATIEDWQLRAESTSPSICRNRP